MSKNSLGSPQDSSSFGYLGAVFAKMANTRRWAVPTSDNNSVVINQSYPLQLLQSTPYELLTAARIAAQGSAVKAYATESMPAAGADLTINLGSVRSFGARVRITDSVLEFKYGTYTVQLRDGATVLGEVVVIANELPAEVLLLGISNAGGQATCTTIINPQIVVSGSVNGSPTVSESTSVWAETLNLRDVGVIS